MPNRPTVAEQLVQRLLLLFVVIIGMIVIVIFPVPPPPPGSESTGEACASVVRVGVRQSCLIRAPTTHVDDVQATSIAVVELARLEVASVLVLLTDLLTDELA